MTDAIAEDQDSFRPFVDFLEEAGRGILASSWTIEEVISYFESEIIDAEDPVSSGKLRYFLGVWLIKWQFLPQALEQLQTGEAEVSANINPSDAVPTFGFLALIVCEQAKCYLALEP